MCHLQEYNEPSGLCSHVATQLSPCQFIAHIWRTTMPISVAKKVKVSHTKLWTPSRSRPHCPRSLRLLQSEEALLNHQWHQTYLNPPSSPKVSPFAVVSNSRILLSSSLLCLCHSSLAQTTATSSTNAPSLMKIVNFLLLRRKTTIKGHYGQNILEIN